MPSRIHASLAVTTLLAIAFSAAPLAQDGQQAGRPGGNGQLGSGTAPTAGARGPVIAARDRLTITTLNEPMFSGKYMIDPDGTFDFPYLGRIKAAGLTIRDLETDIKRRLTPDWVVNPQVSIEVEQSQTKRILISGEVRQTQVIPYSGSITIREALIRAGGLSESAGERAYILRSGGDGTVVSAEQAADAVKVFVDLHELLDLGAVKENYTLQDGDTVVVEKAVPVSVQGQVRSPGAYPIRHGMTVQQVVSLAGGFNDRGKANGIKIERTVPGGKKPQIITCDDKTWKTEVVKPGDTIIVPSKIL
jgi:polysaccharide export outer membrane protein